MAPFFARRPTQQVVIIGQSNGAEADDPASHFDSLLGHGDPFTDPEAGSTSTSQYHPDPDVDSLGSLRSRTSHHRQQHVDYIRPYPSMLDEQPCQPNKLQRRRNQYSYMNPTTQGSSSTSTSSPSSQPAPISSSSHQPATSIARSKSTRAQPLTQQYNDHQTHRRQKSYSLSGGPSWLTSNPLIEVRRHSSVTGERRETKKLQKEHPTGSARPNMSMNLEEGDKGSGLGVRRKMGKLRELYRK